MYQENDLINSFDIRSNIVNKMNFIHPFFKTGNDRIIFDNIISLYIGKKLIMSDNSTKMKSFFEALPFFYFASGHCICTGLGMGIRETLLLQNKNVSKLTILENNIDLIEYHKNNKTPFIDHVEIIHCDAFTYTGSCDTLFLDHFSYDVRNYLHIRKMFNGLKIIVNNIHHNNLWYRGLEDVIISSKNEFKYEMFLSLKKIYTTLPDLNQNMFNDLIMIYENKDENLNYIKTIIDNKFIDLRKK